MSALLGVLDSLSSLSSDSEADRWSAALTVLEEGGAAALAGATADRDLAPLLRVASEAGAGRQEDFSGRRRGLRVIRCVGLLFLRYSFSG